MKADSVTDCKSLAALGTKFEKALAAAGGTTGNASADVQNSAKLFQQFADQVPSSVRPDFQVLAKAFSDYASTLAKINFKPGTVPSAADIQKLAQAAKVFSSSKVTTAEANLAAWAQKTCPQVKFPTK